MMQVKIRIRKPNTDVIFVLPTICLYPKTDNAPNQYIIGMQIHWFKWAMAIHLQKNK